MCVYAWGLDRYSQRLLNQVLKDTEDSVMVAHLQAADVVIFDADHERAHQQWIYLQHNYPHLPVIILALAYTDIAGTVFIQKPVGAEQLAKTLKKMSQKLLTSQPQKRSSVPHPAPASLIQTQLFDQQTEVTELPMCNYSSDLDPLHPQNSDKIYYEPEQYLQGMLQKAWRQSQSSFVGDILIEGLHTPMIVNDDDNQLWYGNEFQEALLHTMTLLPLVRSHIRIRALTPEETEDLKQQHLLVEHPLEAMVWKIALWTARGRLPRGTTLTAPVILHHWPNLTRWILTPHALEIAALWSIRPCSLLETAEILKILHYHVFAFFSAAHAVNSASIDKTVQSKSLLSHTLSSSQRSLFQWLLARLRI